MTNSFLEKLKKGMDLEKTPDEIENKEKEIQEIAIELEEESSDDKVLDVPLEADESQQGKENEGKKEVKEKENPPAGESPTNKEKKIKKKNEMKNPVEKPSPAKSRESKGWPKTEGQLAVDVYQTESELVIQSAIAGVKPEEINISVEGDLITIKGERQRNAEENEDYFSQECYWGAFSRKIILPVEIDPGRIDASLKEGILTIRIPKISREKKRKILVKKL